MSKPVDLLIWGKGYTEAWYQLSKDAQDKLRSQVSEADKASGLKWVVLCDSRWADEEVYHWGIQEFADMNAVRKKAESLEKLQWWRYITTKSILGTKMDTA